MIDSKCERSSRKMQAGTGWGGVEEDLLIYSFLTLAINSNGWSRQQLGSCGRFASLYRFGEKKMSCPHRGSDPNPSARSVSLYRSRYLGPVTCSAKFM